MLANYLYLVGQTALCPAYAHYGVLVGQTPLDSISANHGLSLVVPKITLWVISKTQVFQPTVAAVATAYLIYTMLVEQTLFFNHRSLEVTLSDLSQSEPTASPGKPIEQLWAASSSKPKV